MAPLNMVPAANFGDDAGDPAPGEPRNPPTVDGGTRAAADARELRVTEALRSLGHVLMPFYSDMVGSIDRRASGERRAIERRTVPALSADDAEQHRQFAMRKLTPVLESFTRGLAGSLALDELTAAGAVATAGAGLANAATDEFRAGRQFTPVADTAFAIALQQLSAWALASLPDPSPEPTP